MKYPATHGIDSSNLRLQPKAWRLVVMFRNLQPIIKKQALNHLNQCKNQDTVNEVMNLCRCKNIS